MMKSRGASKAAALFLACMTVSIPSSSAMALECDETHALLKVSFPITQDWDNNDISSHTSKRLAIRPSGNIGNSTLSDNVYYYTLVDYEQCIPKQGSCLEVTMSEIPLDTFEISWDGELIETTTNDQYVGESGDDITSVEVGDSCFPICNEETEAMFEYQYWSGEGFEDYRVEDVNGMEVMGCDYSDEQCQQDTSDSLHTSRVCLPKEGEDACYRFVIGNMFQSLNGHIHETRYSLKWDGGGLEKSASDMFDEVEFGSACKPVCDTENESLVQLFMHYFTSGYDCNGDNGPPLPVDFSWEFSWGDAAATKSGVFPSCTNTSLYHESICIPKNSCVKFTLSAPESRDFVRPVYELTMDGVVYRRSDMNIDEVTDEFDGLSQTTLMGSKCTVDEVCESGQALLEVDVVTPSKYTHENETLPSIPETFTWTLAKVGQKTFTPSTLPSANIFDQNIMDLDTVYRTVQCVSEGAECELEFKLNSDVEVEYTLKRNGVEIVDRERLSESKFHFDSLFGNNCTDSKDGVVGNNPPEDNPSEKNQSDINLPEDNQPESSAVSWRLAHLFRVWILGVVLVLNHA